MRTAPIVHDLVLIGGGHASIQVIKKMAMQPIQGLRITLISDKLFAPYSGMLPGYLAGWYRFEEAHFDLAKVANMAGMRFLHATVCGIDPNKKRIKLVGRPDLGYDTAVINVGSQPTSLTSSARTIPLKPISDLLTRWQQFWQEAERATATPRVAIVGAGAAGIEIALIAARRLRQRGNPQARVTLFEAQQSILSSHNKTVQRMFHTLLPTRGVEVRTSWQPQPRDLDEFDLIFVATEAAAPPWLRESGLPVSKRGFVITDRYLGVEGFPDLFAVGDCIQFADHDLAKAGVFAVRQGPVLAHNIVARLFGRSPRAYRPQHRFLSLLTTGRREVVASYGPFGLKGRWLWHIKDRIDRRFMTRFQNLPPMEAGPKRRSLPRRRSLPIPVANPCGGCGHKIGAKLLRETLTPLKCLAAGRDDSAVLTPTQPHLKRIESIDGFRSFYSDPYLVAYIAVVHALSDIYAMGVEARDVCCHVSIPSGPQAASDLAQVMAGIDDACQRNDVQLVGGHTVEGTDLSLTIVAGGWAEERNLWRKTGAQVGDAIIVTKPLGIGTILAGAMNGHVSGNDLYNCLEVMKSSNLTACKIARAFTVRACTDVTGFGLAGHLSEMLNEDLAIQMHREAIPLLPGFAIASKTTTPIMADRNRQDFLPTYDLDLFAKAITDPQTSGGLVLAVARQDTEQLLSELKKADGTSMSAWVGNIARREKGQPFLMT